LQQLLLLLMNAAGWSDSAAVLIMLPLQPLGRDEIKGCTLWSVWMFVQQMEGWEE
jgi:hypothetical protein